GGCQPLISPLKSSPGSQALQYRVGQRFGIQDYRTLSHKLPPQYIGSGYHRHHHQPLFRQVLPFVHHVVVSPHAD
ncbi:Uncharacterized protein DAT39_020840, partial [Clarias magur]